VGELLQSIGAYLDPEVLGTFLLEWGGRVLAAVVIFLVGRWIALALSTWLARGLEKARADWTLTRFLETAGVGGTVDLVVRACLGGHQRLRAGARRHLQRSD
jgi:NhaP-type Na+/H+ or K+/H+ antiporter